MLNSADDDEIPATSLTLKDAECHPTPLTLSLKQDGQEIITNSLDPSAACFHTFHTSSHNYNQDWPALPVPTVPETEDVHLPSHLTSQHDNSADSDEAVVPLPQDDVDVANEKNHAEIGSQTSSTEGDTFLSREHPPLLNNYEQTRATAPPLLDDIEDNSNLSFNLYQRQANIYSEANLHPYPSLIHAHHSAPEIQPPVELQGQIYFNLGHGPGGGATSFIQQTAGIQIMPMPNFLPPPQPPPPLPPPGIFPNQGIQPYPHIQNQQSMQMDGHRDNHPLLQTFNVIVPQPVYYGFPEPDKPAQQSHHTCCGGESSSGQCQCQQLGSGRGEVPKEETLLQIKIPSWAKLNLDEEENSCLYPLSSSSRSSSRPRLVEYIGDQYHEKNPHTRRTILLNQRRSSDNDPIVFYRFYQFSCPCLGKVWFSPLHRAREGCYCRDCHKFVKPFGHIDGLTPYMGHELCYAKFQCHNCGRSWSCQKSRSNFPDNCFACASIVYPYYQVSHSVLRRKIVRQNDNGTVRFRNWTYSGSSSTSLEDDEEYQEIFGIEPLYFEQRRGEGSPSSHESTPTTAIGSNKTSSEGGANARSASNVCLESSHIQNQSLFGGNPHLGRSISDTVVVLGHHPHQRWSRSEAVHALGCGGIHGRTGFRHQLHRK